MSKKYRIELTQDEREELEGILRRGKVSALKQRHARIVLRADESQVERVSSNPEIAESVGVGIATVERVRRVFVLHGLEACLRRKDPDRDYVRKLDGHGEARLIALACGPAPEGRQSWTLKLLAGRLVELEIVDSISGETVRRTLKKTKSNPG